MTDRRDDELAELVADLQATLRELQDEIEGDGRRIGRRPPRGPAGLPRPPTPREMLAFASDYAIPTTIAFLEANVRALEMLQRVLRFGDPDRTIEEGRRALDGRAARMGRDTVAALNEALARVETEIEEGSLPRSGDARDILEDARRLNRDVGDWIRDAETDADESRSRIRSDEAEEATAEDVAIEIDVDSELDSIRDEVRGDEGGADAGEDSEDRPDGDGDGDER